MRLFTALDISEEARAALVAMMDGFRPAAPFRWSPPDNLHITTKFIGDWPPERYDDLRKALTCIPCVGPIEISISGLGWFPNPHIPRVLFAGIAASAGLAELHRRTDAACASIGIVPETKKFSPHLTLARIKSAEGVAEARRRIAALPPADFGRFTARQFYLYESVPGPHGSEYAKLEEFPLL